MIDECGDCVGLDVDQYNQSMDCSGVCYGSAEVDECGVCAGDSSSCNRPVASDITVEVNEAEPSGSVTNR